MSLLPAPVIDLARPGPSDEIWAAVTDRLPPFVWPDVERLVVVGPHPDDETLGAGGLIVSAGARGLPIVVVSVTDGEAASSRPHLADVRRRELDAALTRLLPDGGWHIVRCGVPDGAVAQRATDLDAVLHALLRPTDLVVCPLDDDGHPDHEATAVATRRASAAIGATARAYPLWAWHCHDPERSTIRRGQRLALSPEARQRKLDAIGCYTSQIAGPDPVVPQHVLRHLCRPFEVVVDLDARP